VPDRRLRVTGAGETPNSKFQAPKKPQAPSPMISTAPACSETGCRIWLDDAAAGSAGVPPAGRESENQKAFVRRESFGGRAARAPRRWFLAVVECAVGLD